MRLKKLTLTGFKSFPDKTEFDFDEGITCIVGPNGCGKSNVVDAVKWVVGEQSAKSLRGRAMLDMVFNGSSTRKSSGMCQVDLHFMDCAGTLATEHNEVTVSRRLFRSGESEYLINRQPVRLKDVRELFMDTGIGVGAYSTIEQGRVDVLLQANPVERRTVFEEAAGISRFKARKKEAVRKLERAEQNLLRVEDIIEEVERRLRSVKYQAGKARHHQAYTRQLRELQASYSLAEYHRLSQQLDRLDHDTAAATDRIIEQRTKINTAEARAGQLDAHTVELDEQITSTEHRLHGVRAEITACRERAEQTRQRGQEQGEVLRLAEQRVSAQQQQIETLRARIAGEEEQAERISTELESYQGRLEELVRQDQEAAGQQAATHADLDKEKANIIDLMRSTAQVNNELASLEQHGKNLGERGDRVAGRRAEIEQQARELGSQQDQQRARLEEIAQQLEQQTRHLQDNQRRGEELDAERSDLSRRLADAKEKRSALESRRHLLQDLDRKMEGIEAGVRDILLARHRDESGRRFGYVRGLIGEVFETEVQNAPLVEAALGDMDQVLIVADTAKLLADADELARLHGRVNTICLDRIPPFLAGPDLSAQPGFVANLVDLVRCPEELERLARHLLGRTVVVDSLSDATEMSRLAPGGRFITRRGELMEADGRVSLGPAGTRAGLVSRKSELRQVAGEIKELDRSITELSDQLSRASAQFATLSQEQDDIRAAISELQRARIQTEAGVANLQSSIDRLNQESPLLAGEADTIKAQLGQIADRQGEYGEQLSALEAQAAESQKGADELQAGVDSLGRRRAELAEQLTERRVQAGQLREKRQALSERINSLQINLSQVELTADQAGAEAESCRQRIAEGERTLAQVEETLVSLGRQEERLAGDALQLRQRREQTRAELEELGGQIKSARASLESAENELHQLQLRRQEAQVRRDELVSRVRNEMNLELADLHAEYQDQEQDWAAVEQEITALKQKIDRLGHVNLDAIAEQEELEKRADFLNTQRNDLVESRRQLESLIQRLDEECRQRFRATFEATRDHFQELFRRLFGGGKANIVLEDPNDLLESGIEIIAQPPGKELLSISLMSGGEKSMTAIALLLAVFKSRPSPFAVLDEVDAALDEANNDRFNRTVTEFLADSQFIIITHSKRTMSIADKLYGVTMQEAGVSTLVSVKFDQETPEGQAVA